ncbi:hypothetical protein [Pseudonocardia sp.]|uniref:hypothetical protein n=1 Tax=Pseudonocardia sp. TaxID=60912 RepID=UPI0031FC50C8
MGVALSRLLSTARLTPAQAVALGTDVLSWLEEHRAGARSSGIRLRPETVRVGMDGRAYLAHDDVPGHSAAEEENRTDLAAAAGMLRDLAASMWCPDAASDHPAADALAAVDGAAAEARRLGGSVAAVASMLREADATGGAEARTELGRLVAAVSGDGFAPLSTARTGVLPATLRPTRPRRRPRRVARTVLARTWKWVLSIVVLVAAVLIEITFLRDTIARDIETVLEAGRSGSPAATSTEALLPVVPPAPPSAGTVTAVDLRAVSRCAPDAACEVRLQVALQPRTGPQTMTWAFEFFDRCTGATATAPGGTVTVPPEGVRAVAVVTVAVPPGNAMAVLARTDLPSTAASAPLLVPSDARCGTTTGEPSG